MSKITAASQKKNALGRGLQAILQDSSYFTEKGNINPLRELPIHQIEINPQQPRKKFDSQALAELQASIAIHGIIQPLTVRQLESNKYQLIAGERRLQAAKKAGLTTVPTYVRTADDQQVLEMALVENIQRENLNPLEIALTYQRLLTECNIKQEELGNRVGKDRTTINNYLRLLRLPPDIQIALRDQKISMGHARALVNVKSAADQRYILEEIMQQNLAVRKVEELVRNVSTSQKKPAYKKKKAAIDPVLTNTLEILTKKLTHRLGTAVKARTYSQGNGEISIPFSNMEELNSITRLLIS